MLLLMFTIHDSASGVYERPFCSRSEADAVRMFGDVACDADHPIGKHPEHFSLWQVGSYQDTTGEIDAGAPRFVCKAIDLVVASRQVEPGSLKGNGPLANIVDDVDDVDLSFGGTD